MTDSGKLSKSELSKILWLAQVCLECRDETTFHQALKDFAAFLDFEFLLYAYMKSSYDQECPATLVNLSNPAEWMQEYEAKRYLKCDPVRIELERRLALGETCHTILWDAYERPLSRAETTLIERRKRYGLNYGFSAFCDSPAQEAVFMVSFASATHVPDEHALQVGRFIAPHLNRCRKRLDLSMLVDSLSSRETDISQWLVGGKTNWEISRILRISESAVKFHMANIFAKLQVNNRQGAISKLLAKRYLS